MKTILVAFFVSLFLLVDSISASAAGFDLDRSFAPMLRYSSSVFVGDIVVQPDGKILVNSNGTLIRLNSDGSADNSFTRLTFYASANVTGTLGGALALPGG